MKQSLTHKILKNKKGQGLMEYLILVALIAVGTIGVVKVVGQNVRKQYANINHALGAKQVGDNKLSDVSASDLNRKDLSNFMDTSK